MKKKRQVRKSGFILFAFLRLCREFFVRVGTKTPDRKSDSC
jgi:hypothetical protein